MEILITEIERKIGRKEEKILGETGFSAIAERTTATEIYDIIVEFLHRLASITFFASTKDLP